MSGYKRTYTYFSGGFFIVGVFELSHMVTKVNPIATIMIAKIPK